MQVSLIARWFLSLSLKFVFCFFGFARVFCFSLFLPLSLSNAKLLRGRDRGPVRLAFQHGPRAILPAGVVEPGFPSDIRGERGFGRL